MHTSFNISSKDVLNVRCSYHVILCIFLDQFLKSVVYNRVALLLCDLTLELVLFSLLNLLFTVHEILNHDLISEASGRFLI